MTLSFTKRICLSACFFALSTLAKGQSDFIITLEGDSIFGQIDYINSRVNTKTCKFRPEDQAEFVTYKPGDILGYRLAQGRYYISEEVKINGTPQHYFLEFLIDGVVDVFYCRDANGQYYFARKEDGQIFELENRDEVVRKKADQVSEKYEDTGVTTSDLYLQPKKYIGLLRYTFAESPKIAERVNENSLRHNKLIDLAKDYHNNVCDEYECVVFESLQPKMTTEWGLTLSARMGGLSETTAGPHALHQYLLNYPQIPVSPTFFPGIYIKHNFPIINQNAFVEYSISGGKLTYRKEQNESTNHGLIQHYRLLELSSQVINFSVLYNQHFGNGSISPCFRLGAAADYFLETKYLYHYETRYGEGQSTQREHRTDAPNKRYDAILTGGLGVAIKAYNEKRILLTIDYGRGLTLLDGFNSNYFMFRAYVPILVKH